MIRRVSLVLALVAILAEAAEEVTLEKPPALDEDDDGVAKGEYIAPTDNVLTPSGEVAIDYKSNTLPEEVNYGDLKGGDNHVGWSYHNQQAWFSQYPLCNSTNMRQSPIDIVIDQVTFKPQLKLEFVDYDQEVKFELKNTHHSVSLTPIDCLLNPSLRVNWIGEQEEVYELQEIHFHWGDGIKKGSEHEINSQQAAAEMHMVHYRKGLNKTQIGSTENSVVVIGVLIESDAIEHNKLEGLVMKTQKVNGTDLEYRDENPENLINLLPENRHSFYTYNGSLTTPPCYEVVTWVVMSEPVYMSQDKLVELSNLEVEKAGVGREKIRSNHRDCQPLLNRPVYASFNTSDTSTYELSIDFHMKIIDEKIDKIQEESRLSRVMGGCLASVNKLRVSVERVQERLARARRKLLIQLGLERRTDGATTGQ